MPAINFRARFASLVKSGRKRQTIRRPRKNAILPGQKLFLYTGMRTKRVRKLKEAVCTAVERIVIGEDSIKLGPRRKPRRVTRPAELDRLAVKDGFDDWAGMREWMRKTHDRLPFEGVLIQW